MDDENELRRTLDDRAESLPDAYDAPPEVVARVRRRRALKQGALALSIVLVVSGSVAAVVGVVGRDDSKRVVSALPVPTTTGAASATTAPSTTTPGPPVPTLACPVVATELGATPPTPATTPRRPAAGDPARFGDLASFAGTSDPRYVVMGPTTWSCLTRLPADNDNSVVVYPPAASPGRVPSIHDAPIAVRNDWLWHGASGLPCQVNRERVVFGNAAQHSIGCELPPGRRLTRVATHVTTFFDADGTQGAALVKFPTVGRRLGDGNISVVTCRPTDGLTPADCGTIVADYVARVGDTVVVPETLKP